jgi:hypothetical protein
LDQKSGRVLWTVKSLAPMLSNIIEYKGMIYVGTSKHLMGFDRQSGKEIFATRMTGVGDFYPVQVRRVGEQIVYISELAIGACDSLTGEKKYRHGVTPIAHLNDLESRIKQLQNSSKNPETGKVRWSSYHSVQAALHQKLAQQAYAKWDASDPFSSSIAKIQYSHHHQMAKDHALQSVTSAMDELSVAFESAWKNLVKNVEIKYDQLIKRCILSSYVGMTQQNFVCRSHVKDRIIYLRCVDLRSGGQTDYPLSPEYQSFGIWNIADMEKGVVYHHGLGLDPSKYEYSEPCWNVKMVNAKWYKSHLIAYPLK